MANTFAVYKDDGGLYRFGHEMAGCSLTAESNETESAGELVVLESGPLRVRVLAQVTLAGQMFQKEYQLVAGEPFLRMRSTGAAPSATSVLVHFPLSGPVDTLTYGTPYHWDRKAPARAGDLTFEAVHDFLIPSFNGTPRGAIFHAGVPAWAVQPDGMVIGALWRNAPQEHCDLYGAQGTDAAPHTVDYAWRVAGGIGGPEQGQQLREALAYQTPLQAVAGCAGGNVAAPVLAGLDVAGRGADHGGEGGHGRSGDADPAHLPADRNRDHGDRSHRGTRSAFPRRGSSTCRAARRSSRRCRRPPRRVSRCRDQPSSSASRRRGR